MAEGQAALNFAEADYDAMLADQQAYADAVAQQSFEMALQMGYSYPDAVAEGQAALEAAEHDYSIGLMQRLQFTPQVQAAMQAAAQADSKAVETEQDNLLAEFQKERKAEQKAIEVAQEELYQQKRAAKLAEQKAAKLAEQKRAEKLAEKRAAKLAEKRAEEEAARKETLRLKREAAEHAAKLAKAEERGRQRAIKLMQEKEAIAQAEAKAYEEELEEGKRVKALFARKEEQERREREALEELRAEKLARERAAQKAAAAEAKARRDAEFAQAMAEIASAKEEVTVTDDGAKKETVMVTPTAPLITVAGDAGMTHSYPQRTFKPEEPKTTETVTLKTGGETGGAVDHTLFACVSLAVMGSVALVTVGKSYVRSPMAAPDAGVELLSTKRPFLDLEDQGPIVAPTEPTWASSAVERALAAAEAK